MDAASRQRRIGILNVVAALVLVCAFWTLYVPHTTPYKNYFKNRKLKETLQAIKPPAGAQVDNISTWNPGDTVSATGYYFSNLQPEALKSHYLAEFARHGFVYKREVKYQDSQTSLMSLEFCAPGYGATLNLPKRDMSRPFYTVVLYPRGAAC
jgi:hypothetical protein